MAGGSDVGRAGRRRLPLIAGSAWLVLATLAAWAVPPWAAQAADPTLTAQASPSGNPVGVAIFDFATLGGGDNPTGTITFELYGPDNPTCAGPPIFTSSEPVAGNGNYQSDSFTTQEAGTYRWIARYSGDAQNSPAATACGDPTQETAVAKRIPSMTVATPSSVSVGSQVTATATLANGAGPSGPTGSITFEVFGPNNLVCADPPAFASTVPVAGNGMYTSPPFAPTAPGTYQWVAVYSGDANNNATGTTCADPAGAVVVAPGLVTPALTVAASPGVALGGQVSASATLSGGTSPTGTIRFDLYGPDDANCSGPPAFTTTVTVTGNGTYPSGPFVPIAAGTYRWRAAYSGDTVHNPVATACTDPAGSVVVSAVATTTSTSTTTAPTTTSPSTSVPLSTTVVPTTTA
ncbi:MAG TPA: Ig-like domain-containing protein, partial [Acidimicrobiales bacterium]|nr:Ig-like domain-containing protein [Acidimicrobiales bacterium]